jgi:hypothetical protein
VDVDESLVQERAAVGRDGGDGGLWILSHREFL